MKAKKDLQKFTDSEAKINKALSLEQITPRDLELFTEPEYNRLFEILNKKFGELKGTENDKLYKKIEPIISETTKNEYWENNHIKITCSISNLMQEHGRMPSKAQIAANTGLSRQTIHKHLKEYTNHPIYKEQIDQFRFMTAKVLANVYQFAVNGDTGAAKLYFNVVGFMNNGQTPNNTLIQNQNNYIQINGTVLSQETVKNLNTEQLNTIETILKAALPQADSF